MKYAEVIVLKKSGGFDGALTYAIPAELDNEVRTGSFVKIPFRSGSLNGIVIAIKQSAPDFDNDKIKSISEIISSISLTDGQIRLAGFISDYYKASMARALRLFLPKKIWEGNFEPPSIKFYKIYGEGKLTAKQDEIVELIKKSGGEISDSDFKKSGSSPAILKTLINKGFIARESRPIFSSSASDIKAPHKILSADQRDIINKISASDKPALLYGVTGSGKTEIYLRRIIDTIKKGKQAILLVPEISLTPQMTGYFMDFFGDRMALFHSKMSESARSDEWWKVKTGKALLAIGSRSAVFAPFSDPGLIIMDEEHEWTYKQESQPYYETHRVAEEIYAIWGSELIFGSATPRAETYEKARKGDYVMAELKERINSAEMPKIHIVDLRDEFKKKNFSIFSLLLQNKIRERLQKKEQIILFVNQRGIANAVVCRDCGYTEKCPNCDISLKLHNDSRFRIHDSAAKSFPESRIENRESQRLVCHYCGFTKAPNLMCPECQSPYIKNVGIGTQRVEQEIKKLFPSAKILRADSDTAKNEDDFPKIYRDFSDSKADILIGTQMIAKGLDFSGVSLIGIILADIGLHIPDFRSSERLFQILTQVSGRCGRRDVRGEVVLQTYNPGNETLMKAASYEYGEFIEGELRMRMKLGYPPFSRIVKFTVVGEDLKKLEEHIKKEKETLEDISKINSLDFKIVSAPSIIPKMSGRYYYNVLIRSENPSCIFSRWKPPKGWRIDVDPVHTV